EMEASAVLTPADGTIERVGAAPAGRAGVAVPGFVDLQVNGFAGVDFLDAEPAGYSQAGQAIAASGVTAYQPTFISSPPRACRAALAALRAASRLQGPRLIGAHLDAPFLSPARPGAH